MKKILLPMLAATMMFAACENEQDVALELTQQKGVTFTVPDFEDESGTRVDVSVDNSGAHFTWTAGDTLGVFPGNGYQTAFPISGGAGTATAVFDGADWALRPNASYAAYYPFVPSMQLDKSKIEVSFLGQTQNGNGSTAHLGKYDYLAAKYSSVSASGDVNFTLNHLGCLVRFQLTMPQADTYTSMTLSCDGVNFATTNKFDLTAATPALSAKSTASSISLALTNIATTEANQVLTLYMMLPPMDLSSKNLAIKVTGEKNYTTIVTGKNMSAGSIYGFSNAMSVPALMHNGHEYVDLGITDDNGNPIYWATCNLGASSPEVYGGYYAWGETETKSTYDWSNYKYCNGSSTTETKYCTSSDYGTVDNKTVLESSDDAATANWGGSWRMPTDAELTKLLDNCTWTWTTQNGKRGYKVTSVNGNYIFLPTAGYLYQLKSYNTVVCGYYNFSTLVTSRPSASAYLYFDSNSIHSSICGRNWGLTIRPVYHPDEVKATSISLSNSTLSLTAGGSTSTLTASILPSNVSSSNICWVSSNPDIATVSETGVVTPVAAGSCTITAITMDGTNLNASCSVKVGYYNNGHEYVDLGITDDNGNPIYWATCNVGANSPEECGDYFAWGETEPKSTYSWSNYKYCNGAYNKLTKYCTKTQYGEVDNRTILKSSDDAATINNGGNWRTPTLDELEDLEEDCSWSVEILNGVNGFRITGPNGNTMFLPVTGHFSDSFVENTEYGAYLSSSINMDSPDMANKLYFNTRTMSRGIGGSSRFAGYTVRPVCQ